MYATPGTAYPTTRRPKRLAENPRTATKAAIKRASKSARGKMRKLDAEQIRQLERAYQSAIDDLELYLKGRAGDDNTLRLEVMRDLTDQANARLAALATERDDLLNAGLFNAADLGTQPFAGTGMALTKVADDAVRKVTQFVADDGLQLSTRIWNLNHQADEVVTQAIQRSIIQGHSASQAAQEFLARGANIPADLAKNINAAQWDKIYAKIKNGLLTGDGSAYANAKRVFRTELNRAHGEAYMAAAFDHPDVIGTRFLLSPNHPKPDICDMHARVNRYGLGPGVYPKDKNPWPAHPNTLSFVEVVFADEVSAEDRAGKQNRIDWLKTQSDARQYDILGRAKRAALQKDLLKESQINTPWRVLKQRYQRQGIDIESLTKVDPPQKIENTFVIGMDPAKFQSYVDGALRHAPDTVRRVIEKTPDPDAIRIIPNGTSYYQGKGITLARTSMVKRNGFYSEYDVYRHEYGHFIDFWASEGAPKKHAYPLSFTPNSRGGLLDTLQASRVSLYAKSKAGKAKVARLRQELLQRNDTNLADLFGALTSNRIGWGHSKAYLRRTGYPETEVFANLFEIYSREDKSAWRLVKKELPELARDFVDLIERLAT